VRQDISLKINKFAVAEPFWYFDHGCYGPGGAEQYLLPFAPAGEPLDCPLPLILIDLSISNHLRSKLGSMNLKFRVMLFPMLFCIALGAETPVVLPPETIVENFCTATRVQDHKMQAASMEVEIAAAIPKLKKQGKLHALRHITALGRITYEILGFEGDRTVKNQVINRYLTAEADAQQEPGASLAVTPENYNFKPKGRTMLDGHDVYQFQVTPKRKRQGLFKGDIWIDVQTFLRVRESGYLVKSPSIFLKRVAFVRKFDIRNGISVPREEQSTVDTRLGVGTLEMTVEFSNFAIDARAVAGEPEIQ
jgi:hypothetical protein